MILMQPLPGIINKVIIAVAGFSLDQAPQTPHQMRNGHIRQRSLMQLLLDPEEVFTFRFPSQQLRQQRLNMIGTCFVAGLAFFTVAI